jgi:hypothetical protein
MKDIYSWDRCLNGGNLIKDVSPSLKELGTIQTKSWVARFILDLIDFKNARSIEKKSILDPGCGKGVFLLEALNISLSRTFMQDTNTTRWAKNIPKLFLGIEINPEFCKEARERVCNFLTSKAGIDKSLAESIAKKIVIQGDFLKWKPEMRFDFVVGNPPYIRYDKLEHEYKDWLRENYTCFEGRADLCIPFIQHGLELLSDEGKLAFICTNRFTLCDYGKSLRDLISRSYGINKIIDFTSIEPFDIPVSTYPWIFVIENRKNQSVSFSHVKKSDLDDHSFSLLELKWRKINYSLFTKTPWYIPDENLIELWNFMKKNSLLLGDSEFGIDIKVGIATGADKIFINPLSKAQIEKELLVPFILSRNLKENHFIQKVAILLNTWDSANDKKLIKLNDWLQASKYLNENKEKLSLRYIAKKNPVQWYRLIDYFDLNLLRKEKLVFPSLRPRLEVYFDEGKCIPHHNCYYAIKVSQKGPSLLAIGAILSSSIVNNFASVLAIKFNGRAGRLLKSSFLNIPMPESKLIIERQKELESAFLHSDKEKIETITKELYELPKKGY